MVALRAVQRAPHRVAEQPGLVQAPLHRERAGAARGMPDIGLAVLEGAAAVADRLRHLLRREDRADRLVAGAEAFRDGDQVGNDAFALECPERSAATHAA